MINIQNNDATMKLIVAIKKGYCLSAGDLLEDPLVNINAIDDESKKPLLLLAIEVENIKIIELLLCKGININACCQHNWRERGRTSLLAAIAKACFAMDDASFKKRIRFIEILLEKHADPNLAQGDYGPPLLELLYYDNLGVRQRCMHIAKLLIKYGANEELLHSNEKVQLDSIIRGCEYAFSAEHSPEKLFYNPNVITNELLDRLKNNDRSIRYLNLGGCGLDDAAIKKLVEAMRDNTWVSAIGLDSEIRGIDHVYPEHRYPYFMSGRGDKKNHITALGASYLAQLPNVRALSLSGNPIGDEGMNYLSNMKNLRSLFVVDCKLTVNSKEFFLRLQDNLLEGGNFDMEDSIDRERCVDEINAHLEANKKKRDFAYAKQQENADLESKVRDAIYNDDVEELKKLIVCLPNGVNTLLENAVLYRGYTMFLVACQLNKPKSAAYLLSIGANIEEHHRQYTPLFHAAENGHNEIVKLLLQHDVNITGEFSNSETPLTIARLKLDQLNRCDDDSISEMKKRYQQIVIMLEDRLRSLQTKYSALDDNDDTDYEDEKDFPLVRQITPIDFFMEKSAFNEPIRLKEYISKLNDELKDKKLDQIDWSQYPRLFVAQYRGIHFHKNNFDTKLKRRYYRNVSHLHRSIHTKAAYTSIDRNPSQMHVSQETKLNEREQVIRRLFRKLRNSSRVKNYWKSSAKSKKHTYPNKEHLLQQRFNSSDSGFHNDFRDSRQSPGINELIDHGVKDVPFCATSVLPEQALRYAFGLKLMRGQEDNRLLPNFHQNGKPVHPYPGKIFISLFTLSDWYKVRPYLVFDEYIRRNINMNPRIVGEMAVVFSGGIPQGYTFYEETLEIPPFHQPYNANYINKFGVGESLFKQYNKRITKANKKPEDEFKEILIKHKRKKMLSIAEEEAKRRGGVLVYFYNNKILASIEELQNAKKKSLNLLNEAFKRKREKDGKEITGNREAIPAKRIKDESSSEPAESRMQDESATEKCQDAAVLETANCSSIFLTNRHFFH